MTTPSTRIERFYGRWASVYDIVATTLVPTKWRARAIDACRLSPGDTVVELGCGTGSNLPLLRDRVGPNGRVVGVDLTPSMVEQARQRVERAGWDNVSLIRGDASRPPITGANVVLGSFVVGLLPDPAGAIETWCALASDRVVVLDGMSSTHPIGRFCNPLFGAFVAAGSPTDSLRETFCQLASSADARRQLDGAVRTSRSALIEHSSDHQFETFGQGFVGFVSGQPDRS